MVGFEESRSHYDDPGKVVVTGTPVRTDFFRYTRKEARAELGLTDDRPLVLSVWGSLGAEVMNRQMAECIALECRDGAPSTTSTARAGTTGRCWTLQGSGLADHPEVDVREYIYDMPLVMAAADLVLCRAGRPPSRRLPPSPSRRCWCPPQRGGRPPDQECQGAGQRRRRGTAAGGGVLWREAVRAYDRAALRRPGGRP